MKRVIIFISVIVLIICLNLSSYSDEFKIPKEGEIVINEEGYKYEEYLFFPWGTKKGEVMYGQEGEYKTYDPFFRIDNDDNIYISSYVHDRSIPTVLKISKGKEIKYFENNIGGVTGILNNGDIISGRNKVYDTKGNFKYRVKLIHDGGELFQDKEGRIYYRHRAYSQFQRIEILDKKDSRGRRKVKKIYEDFKNTSSGGACFFLPSRYTDKIFIVNSPTKSEYSYKIDIIKRTTIFGRNYKEKTGSFIPNVPPENNPIHFIEIIGVDCYDSIYFMISFSNYYYTGKEKNGIKEIFYFYGIYKYDKAGRLKLFFRPFKPNTTEKTKNSIDFNTPLIYRVDKDGNIYQIHISDKGVHIARWGITNEQH